MEVSRSKGQDQWVTTPIYINISTTVSGTKNRGTEPYKAILGVGVSLT